MRIRALTSHANYQCANSGVCCAMGWPIPIENEIHADLLTEIADGRLAPPRDRDDHLFEKPIDLPSDMAATFAHEPDGRCVFLEEGKRPLCSIHRQCGEAALPQTCRHFPRLAVLTPRGVDVNLSHFCPTALEAMMSDTEPLTIIEAPTAFPADQPWEGLDARSDLPPALRPDCLMTWDDFETWEAILVETISASENPWPTLRALARATEMVIKWRPSDAETLQEVMRSAQAEMNEEACSQDPPSAEWLTEIFNAVNMAIPLSLRTPAPEFTANPERDLRPLCRHLACRAFANWSAHQGRGIRTWLSHLICVAACVTLHSEGSLTEAMRRADLMLLHHADPTTLTRVLEEKESMIWNGLLSP